MKSFMHGTANAQAKSVLSAFFMAVVFVGALTAPELAMAADEAEATDRVAEFFGNLNALLNVASIAVVTIAVVFAGYQIAFNNKRISDVAPVLIGGFLIGAAAQIANMLLGDSELDTSSAMLFHVLPILNA